MSVSHHSLQPLRPFSRCACRLPLSRICKSGMTHKLTCITHTLTTHYSPALHNPTVTGYNFLTLIVPAVYFSRAYRHTINSWLSLTNGKKPGLRTLGFFLPVSLAHYSILWITFTPPWLHPIIQDDWCPCEANFPKAGAVKYLNLTISLLGCWAFSRFWNSLTRSSHLQFWWLLVFRNRP